MVTTCSPESQSFVKSLGADETIDYRSVQPSLPAHLTNTYSTSKFDLFFDTVGTDISALYAASPSYLQPDGIYLDIAGAVHIMDDVKSALTTIFGMINRTLRPTFLGGTPRKYLPITFWATSMVYFVLLFSILTIHLFYIQTNELKESTELLASGLLPFYSMLSFDVHSGDRQNKGPN